MWRWVGEMYFFFNDTATTEIYTLSLHDALPISPPDHAQRTRVQWLLLRRDWSGPTHRGPATPACAPDAAGPRALRNSPCQDRKSTRLNSSHANISYAVFCLKKKKYFICTSTT